MDHRNWIPNYQNPWFWWDFCTIVGMGDCKGWQWCQNLHSNCVFTCIAFLNTIRNHRPNWVRFIVFVQVVTKMVVFTSRPSWDGEDTQTHVVCETCQNVKRSICNEKQKKIREWQRANTDKVMQIVFTIATKLNFESAKVKIWLRYQKGPSPFVSNGPLHLKHVVVT